MPQPLFNKHLDIKLLKLVKEYPILYNSRHSSYLNFDAREVVWQKIGDALNRPAVVFAGIQCQIQFENFQEEKHKPGYIENLNEFLPEQYANSWSVEKKILKAYRTHQGLSQLDAKSLYIKTARDLPTYGVTFFLVKEKQKNKMKLVPRLLGINAESILRLDENTKEILQVWPLTHVKTYQVGKSETFTLNFGDYSDKEYSVKTQDAYRIRDILEGYIDLIRKRLLAGPENVGSDGMVIFQDNVQASRGNVIQVVSNNPSKVMEQSFVGPSKLIPYASEMKSGGGTQVVTMQQMVVTGLPNNPQQALKGEVPMRSEMTMDCVRRLNRLNSQTVMLVSLLSGPNDHNVREAQKTVDTINTDIMPNLVDGLNKCAQKQSTEDGRKKMLDEIQELSEYVQQLTDSLKVEEIKCKQAEDTAMKIANLTTQMYAEIDPRTRRRSDLIRKSRRSFIADEKMDSSLRRASFIAAATTALHTLDDSQKNISEQYKGPALDKNQIADREKSAFDKIGKLNAAIALYLTAHIDPKIIDYSTAVNSMNTIKELMPELAKDAQALASARDNKARQQLLDGIRALCDSTRTICTLTGAEDHEKMQDASNKFADVSRKLMFTIGKGVDKNKESEIIKLAKTAADKANQLQKAGNELVGKSKTPEAKEIHDAGTHVANCAKDLLACARMTSSSPHEPHCRSALLAAVSNTSSASRGLLHRASTHSHADKLHARADDLDKALQAINDVCSQLEDADAKDKATTPEEMLRLQIMKTISGNKEKLQAADDQLNKTVTVGLIDQDDVLRSQLDLAKKIAQMNASMATLVGAHSDPSQPDQENAKLAVKTITDLLPEVTRDAKALSGTMDPDSRDQFLEQIRALCQATRDVCGAAESGQGVNDAVGRFSNASGELVFMLSPKQDATKGQQVLDLSGAACDKASQLLMNVHQLADMVGGVHGDELDSKGVQVVNNAQALLTAAQVTSASISEPSCQSSLISTVDGISSSSQQLANVWRQVPSSPHHQPLETQLQELEKILEEIRKTCQYSPSGVYTGANAVMQPKVSPHELQRLKFVKTVSRAKKSLQAADNELDKPDICLLMRQDDAQKMGERLQQKIDELNVAVAALLAASADRSIPDYVTIEESIDTISNLLPEVAKDTKTLSASMDTEARDSLLAKVRSLCDASKDLCNSAESCKGLDTAASRFADASGRLAFTISPKTNTREQQVLDLSTAACGSSALLLYDVKQLSQEVGGDAGEVLHKRGASIVDQAQAILDVAEKYAPTISDPSSRAKLSSVVDILSSSTQDLATTWRQMPKSPRHQTLEKHLQNLEKILGQLRGACQSAAEDEVKKVAEVNRLKFVNSAAGARKNLQALEDGLNKPVSSTPLEQEDLVNAQHRLHQNISELNGAVAALLAATADRSNPDYMKAEKSIDTINKLLPEVVKDVGSLSAEGGDSCDRESLLRAVRAFRDVSADVCAAAESGQGLSEAGSKFADASGKLVHVISPNMNTSKEQQVLDLTAAACGTASQLLSNVHQLSQQVGGDAGEILDKKGARAADGAQALLATAQESASSISEPSSQKSILSTVDALSSWCQDVANSWRQLPAGSYINTLERELQDVEKILGQLRGACQSAEKPLVKVKPSPGDIQRIKFVKSVAVAKQNLAVADEELKKPVPKTPLSKEAVVDLQHQLQQELAQMSGAVAALLTSTADSSNPDYATAEQSIGVVTSLLLQIIKDAKSLRPIQDAAGREAMTERIRALADSSRDICTSAEAGKDLNEAASKFANASGKLMYVINARADVTKGQQVLDLSAVACGTASQLLSNVQQLAQQVGGDAGELLDKRGAVAADRAQALLSVTQITAPSIADPHCQSSTLSSVDALSSSSQHLAQAWRQLPPGSQQPLERELQQLEKILNQIREVCKSAAEDAVKSKPSETQWMKFMKTVSGARRNLQAAEEELDKPVHKTLRQEQVVETQQQLQQNIALMNAAVGSLIVSTADRSNPDYMTAEQAVTNITELLPHLVKQSKTLTTSQDPSARDALLKRIRALCDASKDVCACAENGQGLNEAASKYANASQRLVYVFRPKTDEVAGEQLKNTVAAACGTASQLLSNVQQLSQQVGGDAGELLDRKGARTADDAQALLATAEVTTPSISEPRCQSTLLSSVDALSSSSQELAVTWRQIPRTTHHDVIEKEYKELEQILDGLRKECQVVSDGLHSPKAKVRPEVPKRQLSTTTSSTSTRSKVPPPVPKRHSRRSMEFTQEFLERIRLEEGQITDPVKSASQIISSRKTDDEKHQKQFSKAVEDADKVICRAENNLKQLCDSKNLTPGTKLNANQQVKKQKEMEEKLALANVEVAALVGANYGDKIDYNTASKSINELPQLLTGIVEDGKSLSNSFSEAARQAFLADMIQFCQNSRTLCHTAKNDRQKLKDAAIGFGDKSTKILYTVSSDADPDLEKQIISTSKEIGDSASRLAIICAGLGDDPRQTRGAAATIDSAGALLYTAKLVAPAIHNSTCKEALLASAYKLSNNLKDFSDSWKPMISDPQHVKSVKELTEESENLVQLLEHLRRSARGQQVVEETKETLVVENTPLRVLACKIHQDAQNMCEEGQLTVSGRCEYAQYCDAVRAALGDVDDASLHARRAPHDINKHRELENAIQNLQVVILQNRPKNDQKERSNIVDLRDYIQDVATESDRMIQSANQLDTTPGKKALENIKEECQKISADAARLLEPKHYDGDTTVDDIFEIDTFGQTCDSRISDIKSNMLALEDDKATAALQPRHQALVESCNVLRFATKSGLSTAQSASLDATLEDLYDLDNKVVKTLLEDQEDVVVTRRKGPAVPPKPWVKWHVSQAARSLGRAPAEHSAPPGASAPSASSAFAAYVTDAVLRHQQADPDEKKRLQKHLSKLIHLLKLLTVVTSKRVATWQPLTHPEVTTITDQIHQELEEAESAYSESGQSILNPEDMKKLLTPNENLKLTGDIKHLQDSIQKISSKLGMMSGNVQSVSSPAGLTRSAHATTDAAADLAATARAVTDPKDPIQRKRIEEALQEMSFATYNLLSMSEYVSQRPDRPGSRQKLLEALRQLNDSINKLTRATCPGNKLQQDCEELCRNLQVQQSTLQGAPHSSRALPYADCVNALNSQQEVVDKLKSDRSMSRPEFLKELGYVSAAVSNTTDYASHCAYLISISDQDKEAAKVGFVDTAKIQKSLASVQDTCVNIMRTGNVENMQEEKSKLQKQVESLSELLKDSSERIQDDKMRRKFSECRTEVNAAADAVSRAVGQTGCEDTKIRKLTMELLSAVNKTDSIVDDPCLQPQVSSIHPDTQARCEEVMNNSRSLISKTQALVKQVKSSPEDPETMTWVTFKTGRDQVLDTFDDLLKSIQVNGNRCGILEGSYDVVDEYSDMANKSYVQVQLDTANKWLQRPSCKADTKTAGQQAVKNIIDIGKKMSEDMKPDEKESTQQLIVEIDQLQSECSVGYEQEKYSMLMERLKELKKIIERDLVTRVVEELIEEEEPLADLDILVDTEKDEAKRKYILERKIAELLAQLGRMSKVARFVADAGNGTQAVTNELKKCTDQSELLAPMLVKAAQERIDKPNDKAVVDNYKSLLAKYADSLSRVRDLCDQAVDPMDFVQTAGVMMEQMREASSRQNDPHTCAKTSHVITKLANRVITVSMSSNTARRDPELQRALSDAKQKLRAVIPAPDTRASRLPDWRHTTAEILRTTGEVESVLGGENIFNKQPEPDQPIYSVALNLHASVREWSSRDNEIVAVARRMAVLMARLSDYMNTDKQRELLFTSKQIVHESHEVAYLAKKMAHECTDVRIKTNLLLACERIPTISAQLKMLTTVKGSSLGHQGTKEDKEAMNMLVDNAQSLMMSIQDVVKGAASASVKIMSQHGPRNRWVRRNYY